MSSAVAAAVAKPIAPPSSFAELLRRSRFASYDPAIRQAYWSPAGHAHRGDWGLKRPISVRRRNAFISLASFEHHANFTEWNNAESEVRFIRRIEAMNVTPRASSRSTWFESLGNNKSNWLMDSEFCPGEGNASELNEGKQTPVSANLVNFGNRGPGQYGANRPHERQSGKYVIPNVSQMSQKQFKRYLRKLRALRPEFKDYLASRENKSLYELSQNIISNHHAYFLSDRAAQNYRDDSARKIEDQPHPNAALMYAHPTPLGSALTTHAQPGIILQSHEKSSNYSVYNTSQDRFLASFGGLCTFVSKAKTGGKRPIFNFESEEGIVESGLAKSAGNMRMERLSLLRAPRVVGRRAQGLADVKLESRAVVQSAHLAFKAENMHEPGTPEYIAKKPNNASRAPAHWPKQDSQVDRMELHGNTVKQRQAGQDVLERLTDMTVKVDDGRAEDFDEDL